MQAIVIGAGPAGLATAAELGRRGVAAVVLERGAGAGAAWRGRYDSLHLHTVRAMSGLPGTAIPRNEGRWVSRDGARPVPRALRGGAHARHPHRHDRDPRRPRERRLARRDAGRGNGRGCGRRRHGHSNVPFVPDWPGRAGFRGDLVHSADYRNAEPYRGRDVLVVGSGNSGAEIATGLADGGAARVRLAVRTPPQIVRRQRFGIPANALGLIVGLMPTRAADAIGLTLRRLTIPDLSDVGLPRPTVGPATAFRATSNPPIVDVGIVDAVRDGRVEVVGAVESFAPGGVVLADGSMLDPDAIVAATGFRTGLEPLVGHLGVLDERGSPVVRNAVTDPRAPRLYFVGFRPYLGGLLWEAAHGARSAARALSRA